MHVDRRHVQVYPSHNITRRSVPVVQGQEKNKSRLLDNTGTAYCMITFSYNVRYAFALDTGSIGRKGNKL